MFAPLSASVLFRVCLPMVSWADRVPPAAEPAAPGLLSRTAGGVADNLNRLIQETYPNAGIPAFPPGSAFFADAIDSHSGYEWDLQRADGGTPDLFTCYGSGTSSSAVIDIVGDSGSRFLSAENAARKSRGLTAARAPTRTR